MISSATLMLRLNFNYLLSINLFTDFEVGGNKANLAFHLLFYVVNSLFQDYY